MTDKTTNQSHQKILSEIDPSLRRITEQAVREIYRKKTKTPIIEAVFARPPYDVYSYYRLIKARCSLPFRHVVLVIDKDLLHSSLNLFYCGLLGFLSTTGLITICIHEGESTELKLQILTNKDNYFWSYTVNYFKQIIFFYKKKTTNGAK